MKPRTKLQKAVVKSAETLPPLSEYQRRQAIKHVAPHKAKLNSKGEYVCLDCAHRWHGEKAEIVICPECGAKLTVDSTRRWNYRIMDYFAIITKREGFQIIRMFLLSTKLRKGDKANYWIDEAFQRWITPSGENFIISRKRNFMARYCDSWDWGSDLELRNEHYAHSVGPYKIIGRRSVIPELIRNGFKSDLHECNPHYLFNYLLKDNRAETMWKVGQFELVRHFIKDSYEFGRLWPSIKVVIRHNYHVKDGSLWCDLMCFLREMNKDIRNPKFICPENLQAAHDEWQHRVEAKREREREREARLQELDEEQRYLHNIKKVRKDQRKYQKAKRKFFDLLFTDKELSVKPLVSIQEFIDEGKHFHHCVFVNKYYEKAQSLILHAVIDGEPVATIEFNLEKMEIVQCRGKFNSKPEQYDRIVALINRNKEQIAKKISA